MDETQVRAVIQRWLDAVIIGLNVCPFAAPVVQRGALRMAVCEVETPEDALRAASAEAMVLLDASPDDIATTLVIFPHAVDDFETFLDVAATLEDLLAEAGADGVLQVATLHPGYRFDGVPADDLGNWTNRAPFPILHLLREAHVTDAIDQHPDVDGIPAANIARMNSLGREGLVSLWASFQREGGVA